MKISFTKRSIKLILSLTVMLALTCIPVIAADNGIMGTPGGGIEGNVSRGAGDIADGAESLADDAANGLSDIADDITDPDGSDMGEVDLGGNMDGTDGNPDSSGGVIDDTKDPDTNKGTADTGTANDTSNDTSNDTADEDGFGITGVIIILVILAAIAAIVIAFMSKR